MKLDAAPILPGRRGAGKFVKYVRSFGEPQTTQPSGDVLARQTGESSSHFAPRPLTHFQNITSRTREVSVGIETSLAIKEFSLADEILVSFILKNITSMLP